MKAMTKARGKLAGALLLVFSGLIFVFLYSGYTSSDTTIPELDVIGQLKGSNSLIAPSYFPKKDVDVFLNQLLQKTPTHKNDYKIYSMARPKIFPEKTQLINDYSRVFNHFREQKTHIYDSRTKIFRKEDQCRMLESDLTYSVSNSKDVSLNMANVVRQIVKDMDDEDPYVLTLAKKYFSKEIRLQAKHGVEDRYWYGLSGSSVWLKEYGVHFMVSRLVYSVRRQKDHPKFSVIYAQLFSDDWVEVNTTLLVPTNLDPKYNPNAIEVEGNLFTTMSFPRILPIPFRMDASKDYQGPEDPRIVLVQNERGYEEPLIIFNHEHVKEVTETKDGVEKKKMKNYRNVWMGWPWQFQVGKFNVDDENKPEYDDLIFNRATEVTKKDKRVGGSKNWTPMVSTVTREREGYDKTILFSTRYPELEIFECSLSDVSDCQHVTIDDQERSSTTPGDLRGGTAMVNINHLIELQTVLPVKKLIKKGREIWVGLARAHFRNCGCGNGFYRPNIVVVTLDLVTGEDNKVRQIHSLSHASGFMDLFVDILPWSKDLPEEMCNDHNVLIPNSIDFWKIGLIEGKQGTGEWLVEDMLTLAFSVSDQTVQILKIKGILEGLINMSPNSPFMKYEGEHQEPILDDGEAEELPSYSLEFGTSDDNIFCALEDSKRFCRVYGENHPFDKKKWEENKKAHPKPKTIDKANEAYLADLKNH